MPYYHVFIETDGYEKEEYDLSNKQLESIIEAYHNNERFLCSGSFIRPSEIETIQIYETQMTSENLSTEHTRQAFLGPISTSFLVQKYGKNITRLRIKHPPKKRKKKTPKETQVLSKNVFIVHGRVHQPMKQLKAMLEEFGLNPIVLHEQPSGSRTIVEKLEKYSDVGYAFVILTPDDVFIPTAKGYSVNKKKSEARELHILQYPLMHKARQNVVLEFGYFMGLLGRDKVCCLYKGDIELPSDMHGIVYIPFTESVNEVRDKIVKELKAAGYEIKI